MTTPSTDITKEKFFLSSQCNTLDQNGIDAILAIKSDKMKRTGKTIPKSQNVIVFQGIISQNYDVGEASRNRYKYDQSGWIFDDYNYNPVILWQHDQSYGAIGHAVQFWLDEEKNLNGMFYVDLSTLEPRHANQIREGYVAGISTGAYTVEYMFEENDTGDRLTKEEAEEKYGWENVFYALYGWANEFITLVVTKAKMIENSMVTIGSNEKAMAVANSLGDSFSKEAEEYKKLKNGSNPATLIPNSTSMNTQEIKKDTTAEEGSSESATTTPEVANETPETPEVDSATGSDAGTEGTGTNSVSTNEVATLKDTIEKMKQDHANEIAKLNADHEEALKVSVNKIRAEEKVNLAKVVTDQNKETGTSDVKTVEDMKNKYLPSK